MQNLVVVGIQWGDEGKGKIVDLLSDGANLVVRYGGGNNAGHTLVVGEHRVVLHLVPSGILRPGTRAVLGNGMVIDPDALVEELDQLRGMAIPITPATLLISNRAHLILPYHIALDGLREGTSGALGTTRRGIGPAYEDKVARRGIRVGDLLRPARLRSRLKVALAEANARIERAGGGRLDEEQVYTRLVELGGVLGPHIIDAHQVIHRALAGGARVLFEGAQGILLDVDHGTYPFVTSSTTLPGGVCSGAGVGPRNLDGIVGVTKAYVTRVGEGPFPTEIAGPEGEALRRSGAEYGATTGRPRRCGWLDLPALRYSCDVAGIRWLAVTKLDVLGSLETIKVCTTYRLDQKVIDFFPDDVDDLERVEPVFEEFEPFRGDLTGARTFDDLPDPARRYVAMIERQTGVPVRWVSVGPERGQTMELPVPG